MFVLDGIGSEKSMHENSLLNIFNLFDICVCVMAHRRDVVCVGQYILNKPCT